MITVYTGTPGSGKTLAAVKDIVKASRGKRTGRKVITNIALQGVSGVLCEPNITVDYLRSHSVAKEHSCLLVIDEAQLYFNCREWKDAGRKDWLFFFTHHRKFGYDIILITQSLSFLDKQVRNICEYENRYRRLSRWGKWGMIFVFLTLGDKFFYVEYYIPANERLGMSLNAFMRKYRKYYNTYEIPMLPGSAEDAACSFPPGRAAVDLSYLPLLDYNHILAPVLSEVSQNGILSRVFKIRRFLQNKISGWIATFRKRFTGGHKITEGYRKSLSPRRDTALTDYLDKLASGE